VNLFLDTNVWLSFYHYSNDDLEELRKLIVLIDKEKVKLHLPDQVKDEFWRNREVKFRGALKEYDNRIKITKDFPRLFQDYEPEFNQMRSAVDRYEKAKDKLLDKLKKDFAEQKLKADEIVRELFRKADVIVASQALVVKAFWRHRRGNPPGKMDSKDSIGDAINWECLLENVENERDLYFIADDADYRAQGQRTLKSPCFWPKTHSLALSKADYR
jgi:hypothetical protein